MGRVVGDLDKLPSGNDAKFGSHQETQGTVRPRNSIEQVRVLILKEKADNARFKTKKKDKLNYPVLAVVVV